LRVLGTTPWANVAGAKAPAAFFFNLDGF
jgi:hypothetical protein